MRRFIFLEAFMEKKMYLIFFFFFCCYPVLLSLNNFPAQANSDKSPSSGKACFPVCLKLAFFLSRKYTLTPAMFLLASVGLSLSEPANKFLSEQIESKTSSSQTKQKTHLNCIRDTWVPLKSSPVNSRGCGLSFKLSPH